MEILINQGMRAHFKKVQKRTYYRLFNEAMPKLSQEEMLGLARRFAPIFEKHLAAQNSRPMWITLDLLHSLAHHLDDAGHRELADRLQPLRAKVRFQPGLLTDLDCLLTGVRHAAPASEEKYESLGLADKSENLALVEDLIYLMQGAPAGELPRYQRQLQTAISQLSESDWGPIKDVLVPRLLNLGNIQNQDGALDSSQAREKEIYTFISLQILDRLDPNFARHLKKNLNIQ